MNVSHQLRQLVVETMTLHSEIREEDGLTELQWAKRKKAVMNPFEWGGDWEVRLI